MLMKSPFLLWNSCLLILSGLVLIFVFPVAGQIDLSLIQKFNFHFSLSYLNDYTNANFVDFIKQYSNHFRQEPDKIYAALGYDIMMFYVPALTQKREKFINEPNVERSKYMINSFFFDRNDPKDGWQNRRTVLYKINYYKIISVGR